MEIMPINLTAIVAIFMGISVVLVPVLGLTARFALKPTVEALARVFEGRTREESVEIMERRIALLEQQVEAMESSVSRIEEATRFDIQLNSGDRKTTPALPADSSNG